MSPTFDPMTFDDLSELYRVEMKSPSITSVRRDLFSAMASLLTALRQDCDRQRSLDPDSVMAEGAEQRRKKADRLCKDIVVLRTRKISSMAIRGAEGAKNSLECLTDEERAYYDGLLELTKRQLTEVDRLRGARSTIATRIDEEPVRDVRRAEPVKVEPVPEPVIEEPAEEPPVEEPPFIEESFDDFPEEPFDESQEPPAVPEPVVEQPPEPVVAEVPVEHHDEVVETQLVRVLEDLPEFAGPDRDYKLSKEDVVVLPKVLAEILVNTGKAVAVRPTP